MSNAPSETHSGVRYRAGARRTTFKSLQVCISPFVCCASHTVDERLDGLVLSHNKFIPVSELPAYEILLVSGTTSATKMGLHTFSSC